MAARKSAFVPKSSAPPPLHPKIPGPIGLAGPPPSTRFAGVQGGVAQAYKQFPRKI